MYFDILFEIKIQTMKLLNVGRKQSLTRVLKVKLNKSFSNKIKKRFNLSNRFKGNQSFLTFLGILDLERYFSLKNYSKIDGETVEFKIFNRKTFFLDKNLKKKYMIGLDTLSIKFQVLEIVKN